MHQVIVHQPCGLHVGVDDRAPHELEAALLEVLAERVGFLARGGELIHPLPAIDLGLAVHETPDVIRKRAEFVLNFQETLSIGHRRDDFESITHDARIEQQLLDFFRGEAGDFFRIEVGERLAISFAFAIDRDPTQTGLGAFERQELELLLIVADGHAPFAVMIGNQLAAAGVLPFTSSTYRFGHN